MASSRKAVLIPCLLSWVPMTTALPAAPSGLRTPSAVYRLPPPLPMSRWARDLLTLVSFSFTGIPGLGVWSAMKVENDS